MTYFGGFRDQVADQTFDGWKDCLMSGTDKIRCEYCLDQNNWKMFEVNSRSSEEVSYREKLKHNEQTLLTDGLAAQKGRQACFFTAVSPLTPSMLNSSRGRKTAENDSLQSEAGKSAHCNLIASILKLALVEKMGMFWANNFQMQSLLHEAVPADCCVKVVTGNRADILYQRGTPEPREAPRVAMQQAPHVAWRDPSENLSQDGQTTRTLVRWYQDFIKNCWGTTSNSPNESTSKAVDQEFHQTLFGSSREKEIDG